MLTLSQIIDRDPTLRFLLREATIDPKIIDYQIEVKIAAYRVALGYWLNQFN